MASGVINVSGAGLSVATGVYAGGPQGGGATAALLTAARLPTANSFPPGTTYWTSDLGLMFTDGTQWNPFAPASANITPDTHPSVANPADDEFETGSVLDITGARRVNSIPWTEKNKVAGNTTALANGYINFSASAGGPDSPYLATQPITAPNSPWRFICKPVGTLRPSGGDCRPYLFVGTGATGKGYYLGRSVQGGAGGIAMFCNTYLNYQGGSAANLALVQNNGGLYNGNESMPPIYFAARYDGASILAFDYCFDGVQYTNLTFTTPAGFLGTVPDTIGIGIDGGAAGPNQQTFDLFRRTL